MREHRQILASPEVRRDLTGGILRLRVIAGETWRTVLTPDAERGAVTLPAALRGGRRSCWCGPGSTICPTRPRDHHPVPGRRRGRRADAAARAREWAALIDEFGGVLSTGAGERALALMQRARSAGGQVAVTTQSVIDFAAATGNPALLDALADNFAAGIFHLQSSPESRDWLARLIGTREVWQSTDRTTARRRQHATGCGSRRRVREFLVRPDELRTLAHRRGRHLEHARARRPNASPSPPPRCPTSSPPRRRQPRLPAVRADRAAQTGRPPTATTDHDRAHTTA